MKLCAEEIVLTAIGIGREGSKVMNALEMLTPSIPGIIGIVKFTLALPF